jgi:hypothetical protein
MGQGHTRRAPATSKPQENRSMCCGGPGEGVGSGRVPGSCSRSPDSPNTKCCIVAPEVKPFYHLIIHAAGMHMLCLRLMQPTKGDDDLREDYSAHANKVYMESPLIGAGHLLPKRITPTSLSSCFFTTSFNAADFLFFFIYFQDHVELE